MVNKTNTETYPTNSSHALPPISDSALNPLQAAKRREQVLASLESQGYDTSNSELVARHMQAVGAATVEAATSDKDTDYKKKADFLDTYATGIAVRRNDETGDTYVIPASPHSQRVSKSDL